MAKTVGFLCMLKLAMLDKALDLVIEGVKPADIKEALNDYISLEIKSPDNTRKRREMLMNLWVKPFEDERANQIRNKAIESIRCGSKNRIALHWCMLLLYYPVFSDVSGIIGKMLIMQDSFSQAWLKEKMAEKWGERATLLKSVERVMQTMVQLRVLNSEKGIYSANKIPVSSKAETIIIIKTILALQMRSYYEPSELTKISQMFPFKFSIDPELIFGSGEFEIGNFGGNPVVIG